MPAPEPDEIYERTRREGERRLSRPPLELAATALVGGFDVAFGVAAFGLAAALVAPAAGAEAAHLVGAIAFGIAFVFVAVGRSELFTENFLVPLAGMGNDRRSYRKLAELWIGAFLFNLLGGTLLAVVLTTHDVLRGGVAEELVRVSEHVAGYSTLEAFLSAVVAGALMTLMTWFVEGASESMGVTIAMSWIVGSVIALGSFNHAVVGQIELVFGMRYGADISYGEYFDNMLWAVVGNLVGGLGLVTVTRATQALAGSRGGSD